MSILDKLKALDPRLFENLSYDLLIQSGITNLVWRTPGADRGRDLEGEKPVIDFSGTGFTEKWYIECKRYESSIDWPTVFGKLSYAMSNGADYLLMITTSNLSTNCVDEVNNWNRMHKYPKIRWWPGYYLENSLQLFPSILLKYGLALNQPIVPPAFLELAQTVAKATAAAMGRDSLESTDQENLELTFAGTLAELMQAKMLQYELEGRISPSPFKADIDGFECDNYAEKLYSVDKYALRAILAFVHMIKKCGTINVDSIQQDRSFIIDADVSMQPKSDIELLNLVAFWESFQVEHQAGVIKVYE